MRGRCYLLALEILTSRATYTNLPRRSIIEFECYTGFQDLQCFSCSWQQQEVAKYIQLN